MTGSLARDMCAVRRDADGGSASERQEDGRGLFALISLRISCMTAHQRTSDDPYLSCWDCKSELLDR